jgi:hypothetical protein
LQLTGELDRLEADLDEANRVLFQGLSGPAKSAALEQVLRMRNKFDALGCSVLTSFEMTQEHRHEGHGSVVTWAKTHSHVRGPEVAGMRRLAHRLRDLPKVEGALRAGQVTEEHVGVLHRAYRLLGPSSFAVLEEPLVDSAVQERFSDFVRTVDYVIVRAAPAGADERARRDLQDRYASSSSMGSHGGKVDAQFEPIGFAIWQAELERNMDQLLEDDRAEARDRLGRAPTHAELRRTTRQRRVDAMVVMARRSAAHGDEKLGPAPFTTVIHIDPAFLTALIAVLSKAMNPDGDPDFDLDAALDEIELTEESLHELDDGTVITVNTVVLALLTGTIRGIHYGPDGEVLHYGRERRPFSLQQRDAARARSRRCAHPWGCDRTGPSTQTDHRHEHQDGGLTDIDNADRYCGPHNIWKTNHRNDPPPPGAGPPDTGHRRTPPRPGRRSDTEGPDELAA